MYFVCSDYRSAAPRNDGCQRVVVQVVAFSALTNTRLESLLVDDCQETYVPRSTATMLRLDFQLGADFREIMIEINNCLLGYIQRVYLFQNG